MKMLGLISGEDGQSHFAEIELPEKSTPWGSMKVPVQECAGWEMGESPPGNFIDWHVARVPRVLIVLQGALEVGVGSGEVRRFGPGDALYAQDTTGQGHTSHFVGDTPTRMITIPIKP
ncbi:MAG: cupin domain-containing protein [Rhodobacteraceae bacterium]|nr:cupin domain-containing protein [Paracoccaceae bacterium]